MNGLNFVRTRCNISVSELADILGVSRQAINLWEKGKKPVLEERKSQLAEYFGLEKEYFGEITEEQKQVLLEEAMFRRIDGDKEYYLYKPCPPDSDGRTMICFPGDKDTSVDEDYLQMQRHMKTTLEKASEIIRYYDRGKGTGAKTINIRRGCRIYDGMGGQQMRCANYVRCSLETALIRKGKMMADNTSARSKTEYTEIEAVILVDIVKL